MSFRQILLAILLALSLLGVLASPTLASQTGMLLPRVVVALYDSREGAWSQSRLRALTQASLNRIGLKVEAVDVAKAGLPDLAMRRDVRGILTWWVREPAASLDYWSWASRMSDAGKRFVVFGSPAVAGSSSAAAQFWARMGVDVLRGPQCRGFGFAVQVRADSMVQHERALPPYLRLECGYRVVDEDVDVFLRAQRGNESVDLVLASARGAIAAEETIYFTSGAGWQLYLNLDAFFARAFKTQGLPVPDFATRNGRRVFVAVVDAGMAGIDQNLAPTAFDSLIEFDKAVLSRFRHHRFGLSFQENSALEIACSIQEMADATVSEVFARSNLEVGVRLQESATSRGGGLRAKPDRKALTGCVRRIPVQKQTPPNLSVGRADQPRLVFAEQGRLGEDKTHAKVYDVVRVDAAWQSPLSQWTPVPAEEDGTLSLLRLQGSYGSGEPSSFDFLQFLNDARRTDAPARRAPIGIAIELDQLRDISWKNGLLRFLSEMDTNLSSLFPTEFADLLAGFSTAELRESGTGTWTIAKRGALQTIRIDNPKAKGVDLTSSQGVIGWTSDRGSLLIWLDEAVEPAVVKVTADESAPGKQLLLEDSAWRVWDVRQSDAELSFSTQGAGEGTIAWRIPKGWCVPLSSIEAVDLGSGREFPMKTSVQDRRFLTIALPASNTGMRVTLLKGPSADSCSGDHAL